jgi:hypothetical protein
MMLFKSGLRALILPLFLLAGSCTNEPDEGGKPQGSGRVFGIFHVSLVQPLGTSLGHTLVVGNLYDGPTPSPLNWKETAKGGSCRLLTPTIPVCATSCGPKATCVADDKCQDFATSIQAGRVSVDGIKSRAGATAFTMDPTPNNDYLVAGGTILAFPPFAEGDAVRFSAAGNAAAGAFSITAKGIVALEILNDSISLEAGKAIGLKWTPPANPANTSISVLIDISHHGGSKGKIECEGPDNGAMEIPAALVDQLKALGVSGFPKIEVARRAIGTSADVQAEVVLESLVTRDLIIPGLISCEPDDDVCPDGQTCDDDLHICK